MQRNLSSSGRILLVESDAPFRRSLENGVKRAGYSFDSCSTCEQARRLAKTFRYDVGVVEYHLRDGNGARLVAELKTGQAILGAVLISFYDFEWISRDVVPVADEFLKKPFDLSDFERILKSLITTVRSPALLQGCSSSLDQAPAPILREGVL
ncbi:response regulator [Desulfosoma caldarium]|uniref:Response regulator receiver domain-containing protein n=1 Tax=Desulfosoma caldarium TaxID=610254 RepID=A0A3N1UNS2_9BACT|nr:response regulator [Desulfosoma caldarium]ROQ89521.1 response regulator receiver domain-containing protein [Desulfosoma caldarium]